MMIIPNTWKNESHVPNHQPEYLLGSKRLTHMLSQSHLRNRFRLKYEEKKYEEYQPGLLGFFAQLDKVNDGKRISHDLTASEDPAKTPPISTGVK